MTTIKIKNNNYQNKKALWKELFPHKALDMIIHILCLCILDPVNDPCANLCSAIVCTTLYLNLRCADIGIREASTALRIKAPSSFKPKCSSNMAAERI